jgi:hypothetical protein
MKLPYYDSCHVLIDAHGPDGLFVGLNLGEGQRFIQACKTEEANHA